MAAAASAPRFKQFNFFNQAPVKDAHDLSESPHIVKNAVEISTVASSSVGALVADVHGSVHVLDKDFEPVMSWVAHVGGRVTHMEESRGVLVTLGEEDAVQYPLLKIWNLDKTDKNGFPVLLRSTKVAHSSRRHPVSCAALASGLSTLAIGLGDGTVLLYRHLDQSVFSSSTSLSALPKPRVVHESSSEPVTGLGFREPNADSPNLYLFIATTNRVLSYQASGRGSGGSAVEVHEHGASLNCTVMDFHSSNLFVARDEAIYVSAVEGRGASYAVEGPKLSIHAHRNYLVIVSPPLAASAASASPTIRFAARREDSGKGDVGKVTVFDPENKMVAFSDTFAGGVRSVLSQWGSLYVLTNDGILFCLQEKPTPEKLGMLYQRQQHTLALSIAKTQNLDDASVADIHRQYGDYLYGRGDYDGAMQQYLQTIGQVQPSYVIRKFLDAQRIHNLVTYLQEVHALGLANADHTTLLLNTYTKLKDVSRLDSFIKTESRRGDDDKDELPFDLDTAIRVCRQAGYFEHASYLAKRWERHEDYLRIQIEDAGNFKDALVYLRMLGANAAETSLARYGRKMLEALPDETTQLLIDICTNPGLLTSEPEDLSPQQQPSKGGGSYLSYLNLNRTASSTDTGPASSVPTEIPPTPKATDGSSRKASVHEGSRASSPPETPGTTSRALPTYIKRPSPRLYFANFVSQRSRFVTFLETVARRRWGQTLESSGAPPADYVESDVPPADEVSEKADQSAVWNTLLELYLAEGFTDKALSVLKSSDLPYDPTHALILCSTRDFTRGLVLLWERLGMHEDVLRFWMDRDRAGESGAGDEVMRCLELYGSSSTETARYLYPLVLRFLTESTEVLGRHRKDLEEVLRVIEEEGIMPPLGVVGVLSRNGVTSVGVVKSWLLGRIHEAREEIQTDEQLINSYRLETQAKLKQVEALSDADHPRVFHNPQCATCGGHLDLPAIHFMCNHSYHQRCLANNETECPECARSHAVIRDIRRNNERLADQHDLFLSEVKESGFSAIAAGFGRGVLNVPRAEDVAAR